MRTGYLMLCMIYAPGKFFAQERRAKPHSLEYCHDCGDTER